MCFNTQKIEGMLYGAYIGKIKYLLDQGLKISIKNFDNDTSNIMLMIEIMKSIQSKQYVCPNDICIRLNNINVDNSIVYSISPLSVAIVFDRRLDESIKQITKTLGRDEEDQLVCIEFIHLVHDIFWHDINKDTILNILPELDVLESEVKCGNSEKNVFFAALWSFIFSKDYTSCYEKASNLNGTNSDIVGVASTFAGLYYGIDSIPIDWAEQVFETETDLPYDTDLEFLISSM